MFVIENLSLLIPYVLKIIPKDKKIKKKIVIKSYIRLKKLNLSEERFFVRHRNLGKKNDFGLVLNNRAGSVDYTRIGQDQKIKDKLIKNTSEAVEKGVFGAPSLLVNNELFFGKETLQDVEELLVKEAG